MNIDPEKFTELGISAIREMAEVAKKDFQQAETILHRLERKKIRPIIIMKNIYQPTLKRLIKRGWTDLEKSVRLSKVEKMLIILRSGCLIK